MNLTIIALINVCPPSANDPAVAAKAEDEAIHKIEKESGVSILREALLCATRTGRRRL